MFSFAHLFGIFSINLSANRKKPRCEKRPGEPTAEHQGETSQGLFGGLGDSLRSDLFCEPIAVQSQYLRN